MDSAFAWITITVLAWYGCIKFFIKIAEEDARRKAQNRAEWDELRWN